MNPVGRSSLLALAVLALLAVGQMSMLSKHFHQDEAAEDSLLNLEHIRTLTWELTCQGESKGGRDASASADRLLAVHELLVYGSDGQGGGLDPAVRQTFFEPPFHLDLRVRSFLTATRAEAAGARGGTTLANARAALVTALAGAHEVLRTQRQEQRYRLLVWMRVFLALDVAVLLLIGIFIVRPTLRRVQRNLQGRIEAEQSLREANTFLDSIVENIPDMIFVKEARELRFVRFNKAGEELLGYRRGDLMGRNDYDFFPRAEADFFTSKDRGVLRSGRLLDIPEEPIHTRRGPRWLHTKKIPIRDEEGQARYLLGISEDITERKQAMALADGLHRISDQVTRTTGLKEFCTAVHAVIKDLLPARNFYVALHDERRHELWFPYFVDAMDPAPERRPVGRGLTDYVLHQGRPLFVSGPESLTALAAEGYAMLGAPARQWLGAPLLVGGRCIGVLAVQTYDEQVRYDNRDLETLAVISQQVANAAAYKQAEEHLRLTARQLLEAQSLAGLGTWEYDPAAREFTWSAETFRIAGFPLAARAPTYEAFLDALHPEDRPGLESGLQRAVAEARDFQVELRHRRPDGGYTYAVVVGHPVMKEGRVAGLFGTVLDISGRKKAEQEIKERFQQVEQLNHGMLNLLEDLQSANEHLRFATRQLEEANAELEAFSYSVSHDLRAPLRAIDGFAQALMEDHAGRLDDDGRRCVEKVGENARDMGRLIDGLLEFARLSRQALAPETVDMTRMVRSIWHDLVTSGGPTRAELQLAELPPAVGDALLLHQVWVNLLSNAVKFTRAAAQPKVDVGCTLDAVEAVYYVRDNGVGFDMKYADKLFGVFQRLHSPGEFEGTGLGTAIVQRIVQRHGGRVWAEAQVDRGATFYFSLPRKEPPT